jgi:predicted esterase
VVAVRLALTLVDKPLGGVIAVSSSLLEEEALTTPLGPTASAAPARTPLLVTHGRRDRVVPLDQARRHLVHVRSRYGAAKAEAEAGGKALVRWKEYEKGHEMIKSQEEMQDVMAFLAEHLRLRSVALERRDDLIEVTPGHPLGQ